MSSPSPLARILGKVVNEIKKSENPELPLEDKSEFKLNLPPKAHKQHIKMLFASKPGEIKEFVSDCALRLKRI